MDTGIDFETRIDALDLSLFEAIPSQSSPGDRLSLLVLQAAVRKAKPSYVYLEIGSHLGGSIQQHMLDPRCRRIYSIDKRSPEQPDDRGPSFPYENNTTARMLENLRALSPEGLSKVECFESEAQAVNTAQIDPPPDFCFIDGEHTREAVRADFEFCLRVAASEVVIAFHDDWIIYPELVRICQNLKKQKRAFRALKLRGVTFAICLGGDTAAADKRVRALSWFGYWGLKQLALRRFVERWFPARLLPRLRFVGRKLLHSGSIEH